MSRIAPAAGYERYGKKNLHRHHVWNRFARDARDAEGTVGRGLKKARALLMPSKEGFEIGVALGVGFHLSNLLFFDAEPAIAAGLTSRYPGRRQSYGCSLAVVGYRMLRDREVVEYANLDLTGTYLKGGNELLDFLNCLPVTRFGRIALTVCRGHETGKSRLDGWLDYCDNDRSYRDRCCEGREYWLDTDDARITAIVATVRRASAYLPNLDRCGIYRSAGASMSMLWMTLGLIPWAECRRLGRVVPHDTLPARAAKLLLGLPRSMAKDRDRIWLEWCRRVRPDLEPGDSAWRNFWGPITNERDRLLGTDPETWHESLFVDEADLVRYMAAA